ncbi:MAG: rod shape-determining protein MreD [Bryobacteraceae bacterium]
MSEYGEPVLLDRPKRKRFSHLRTWVLFVAPLVAILCQVYVPLFFTYFSLLDLPLLVTVYLSVARRHPISGIFIGAGIGLAQDSLSDQPLGTFGIVKTLVGFLAASLGTKLEAEHSIVRFSLGFLFFTVHQVGHWFLSSVLLGQHFDFEITRTLVVAGLNGLITPPLFFVLDKLRVEG